MTVRPEDVAYAIYLAINGLCIVVVLILLTAAVLSVFFGIEPPEWFMGSDDE